MRRVSNGNAEPLAPDEVRQFRGEHLPYRLALLRDAILRVPARTLSDDQAFEAGAVAGRVLLAFLGLGFDPNSDSLREDRRHHVKNGLTDDVKVVDVGGRFVDIASLSQSETAILTRFIHGVHKACAHLTSRSKHALDVATFQRAVPLIERLYDTHIGQA
jgi:hypothetical protein